MMLQRQPSDLSSLTVSCDRADKLELSLALLHPSATELSITYNERTGHTVPIGRGCPQQFGTWTALVLHHVQAWDDIHDAVLCEACTLSPAPHFTFRAHDPVGSYLRAPFSEDEAEALTLEWQQQQQPSSPATGSPLSPSSWWRRMMTASPHTTVAATAMPLYKRLRLVVLRQRCRQACSVEIGVAGCSVACHNTFLRTALATRDPVLQRFVLRHWTHYRYEAAWTDEDRACFQQHPPATPEMQAYWDQVAPFTQLW